MIKLKTRRKLLIVELILSVIYKLINYKLKLIDFKTIDVIVDTILLAR